MIDLLTIGDCSMDLFMKVAPDSVVDETNEAAPKICFYHGSKIPVDHFETTIAGNALNVAVAVTKLGLKTTLYTEIGNDQNAEKIISELRELGVNTTSIHTNKDTLTDVHTVIVYGGDRTIFSYHGARNYSINKLPEAKWIYYTSMGAGFERFQHDLVSYVTQKNGVGLAFNPGTMQMKAGVQKMLDIIKVTDILFVNKDEAQRLTNYNDSDYETLHKKLAKMGPSLTVITDGENGASAYNGNELVTHGIYSDSRPLMDRTGSGDAFSSGFMGAILYGKPIKEALRWGIINSGSVIKVIGATRGLLTKNEIEKIASSLEGTDKA